MSGMDSRLRRLEERAPAAQSREPWRLGFRTVLSRMTDEELDLYEGAMKEAIEGHATKEDPPILRRVAELAEEVGRERGAQA